MTNESKWKCPIHSISGDVRQMDQDPMTAIEDVQLVISQARTATPSKEYYFRHVRPINNALVAHFLQNPIGYLYNDAFNQDIEIPSEEFLKVRDYQDRFDGYQGAMYITLHQAIQLTENHASQMFTPEDLTMWNQFGICSGELLKRHNMSEFQSRESSQLVNPEILRVTSPQGMLIASGAGTIMRFTNVFRNMCEAYPWDNGLSPQEKFHQLDKTAKSTSALLNELMRLPTAHGGAQLLGQVLSGVTAEDKHVDDRFFDYDYKQGKTSLSQYYWGRKNELVDPEVETTLCPAHFVSLPLSAGGRINMSDYIIEDALHGAQQYLFAPRAGLDVQLIRQ